ncbi:hypothetical protein MKW98_005894 [Papaver atlanticum]|uniref:ATP synthase epsilon chain, chloroplastic n=1 Tax=Papaver atlanticum TaxID=357466 RepID=A0AAD4XV49_9MAGN|nr:hypothetical protein MKW98_005894 [Papaver atlanticum]
MAEYFRYVNEQGVLLFIYNIFQFYKNGYSARKNYFYQRGVYIFYSISLCTCGRFDRPFPCHNICTFKCYTSTMLQPRIVGEEHYEIAQRVKQTSQRYKELQDIIAILGLDKLFEEDRLIVARERKTESFLSQPFFVAEVFTGALQGNIGEQIEEMTLNLCVLTPNQIVWDSGVKEIVLSTNSGQIGVLPNHSPIATAVDIGILRLRLNDQWLKIALIGGFARVGNNEITILVNDTEKGSDIDPQEAQKALEIAEANLSQAEGKRQTVEENLAVRRARTRVEAINEIS